MCMTDYCGSSQKQKSLLLGLEIKNLMKSYLLYLLIFAFTNSLIAQGDCFQVFYNKGIEAFQKDSFEMAINNFKAAKVCPDKPADSDVDDKILEAQNGFIIAITKARDEAIAAKLEAEQAKRSLEAVTYFSLGQEKELQKLIADAIFFYSKGIKIFPDSVFFYERRAPLYLHKDIKEFEKAILDFAFLIKSGNKNKLSEYCDKLAYAYEQIGEPALAIQYLFNAKKYAAEVDKKIYEQKLVWFDLRQEALAGAGISNESNISPKPVDFSIVFRESEYPDYSLGLNIKIGEKIYFMKNNNFIINDLPAGEYDYQLSGNLNGWRKSIEIIGEGKLKIIPNSVYYCVWKSRTDAKGSWFYKAWLSPY
jgi:tetratricopeptide (TPR) repeat protein